MHASSRIKILAMKLKMQRKMNINVKILAQHHKLTLPRVNPSPKADVSS